MWGPKTGLGPTGVTLAALFAGALLTGCGNQPAEQEPPLETEDIVSGQELSIENDTQAAPRKPSLSGVLPGDFPEDLPLHLPASLIDFENSDAGPPSVTLLSPSAPETVTADLRGRIGSAGWTQETRSDGSLDLRKGQRHATLQIEDANPGTRYTYTY